jgi:hypothetical protein
MNLFHIKFLSYKKKLNQAKILQNKDFSKKKFDVKIGYYCIIPKKKNVR